MSRRPNILLLLTDQHRSDCLGANGSICRTRHLDALAVEAVNFRRAYTVCPLCTPARAAIYTGLLPHRTGVTRNLEPGPNAPAVGGPFPTIAERLNEIGYRSVLVGKWHAGSRAASQCGFESDDFSGYGDPRNSAAYAGYLRRAGLERPEIEWVGFGYPHRLALAGVASGPEQAQVPAFVAASALERLAALQRGAQPWFLAVNFWGPHAPYVPCEPFASMYPPSGFEPWPNFGDDLGGKPPIYRRWRDALRGDGEAPRGWDECSRWLALGCGFITQIDVQIGRLLEAVRRAPGGEDTLVVFSSDHGDLLGAHGGMHDKDGVLCEELMRVPLLVRPPGGAAAGAVSPALVSNIDIPATILDFAGAPAPEIMDGRSLRPAMTGGSAATGPVFAQFFGSHFAYEARMVVAGDYKYVFHPGATDELYHLGDDPWEMCNRIGDSAHAAALRRCREHLLVHLQGVSDPLEMAHFLFQEPARNSVTPYGRQPRPRALPPVVRTPRS
jgi:arylsulfatase A-like enzyme